MESSQDQSKQRRRRVTPRVAAMAVTAGVLGLLLLIWAGSRTKIIGDTYLGSVGTNTGVCLKLEHHGSTAEGLIQFLDRERVRVEFTGEVTATGITGRFVDFYEKPYGLIELNGSPGSKRLTGRWHDGTTAEPESVQFDRIGQLGRQAWRTGFRIGRRGHRSNVELIFPILPDTDPFAGALAKGVKELRSNPPHMAATVDWNTVWFAIRYGSHHDWETCITVDVVHSDHRFLSLRVFAWGDTGGAHGNWSVCGVNFIQDGDGVRELELEDIFQEGSEWFPMLSRLIIAGLRDQEASGAMDEDYTLNRVDLTFTISERGLVFMFSPYEVASYAEGAFFVTVPWESLRAVLRPNIVLERFLGQEPDQ